MNSLSPLSPARALALSLFLSLASPLHAQVGDNNPGGHSGIFNGQVNTGCSYDPYTGNATRSITDIAVAGAVGEYPLALVRTANSRTPSTTEVFGWAGGWNHNYNWILEDSPTSNTANFQPKRYTVDFPDGRVETFRAVTWDTVYRVRPGADTPAQSTSAGVRERFLQLNLNNMYAYLILPDGGAVEFKAQQHSANGHYYYKYHVTGIYDPYGLKTTLVDEVVPNGTRRRLVWVIDPSGQRNLHFTYTGPNNAKIASVEASDGRVVNYYYINCNGCWLDRVRYYNNPAWDARYQYCGSNVGQGLPPLLWTADDPMYAGPMKRIAYDYKPLTPYNPDGTTPVYGQILRERYWDGVSGHEASGAAVSTLAVGTDGVHTGSGYRKETRAESATRGFVYNGAGNVTWVTDFMSHSSTYGYDSYKYRNSFIDFNRNETDYTCDPITGNITQIKFPLTPSDTPGQGNTHPTVNYTYTNSYYLHTVQDEGSHTTTFTRDNNNRVTRIDYPDGGYETFGYDASHFYQLNNHRMTTGGTETFTYDWRHRKDTYRNPDTANMQYPTAHYFYDGLDRMSGVLDALNHPTNWEYNDRGQVTVTTLSADPVDNTRHTISNAYNPDGTLQRRTDQLSHITSYTYDDYRRLKSVTPPVRGFGDSGTYTTNVYYDANGTGDDYRYTDSHATYVKLPSAKKTKTVYDDNRRKSSVTVGYGSGDDATISYLYDGMNSVTWLTNPRGINTHTIYDQRNRPSEVHDPLGNITSFTYDTAGRRKTINRPNGQVITNASFDEMNKVLQQNVTQTPDPLAVTKYTYYPSGLLNTMTDPRNSTDSYTYVYDLMGRKQNVTYPANLNGNHWTEHFTYDAAGRLDTFKNRKGDVQTFHYDVLNRLTYFTWDDNLTPRVDFNYDVASRLTEIDNVNATITRAYFNDNLRRSETEVITGGRSKQVAYTYNADGGRATITYPDYQAFAYTPTGRNQVRTVGPWATYTYDENSYTGDLTTRTLNNGTQSTYLYDPLDRVTWITHALTSGSRGFNYGYDNVSVADRLWTRRTGTTLGDKGDVFSYDLADQVSGVQLNVTSPQSTPAPPRSIYYDANGNRTTFQPYGTTDTYVTNNLNQYTSRNANNGTYDANGNLINTPDPAGSRSTYSYDAQNRLLTATKSGATDTFAYDGLNRQVGRTVGGATVYNVWDGWDLIEEYQSGGTVTAKYVHGPGGPIKELVNNRYYYQDGSGSTSHLADSSGNLLEWYRYDLQGTPFFYAPNDTQRSSSNYSVRHLFTGQQWYSDIGLYDLRNRFYSPDIGRFLQPDPIGFDGDATNLYRYAGNNPVTSSDPMGLDAVLHPGGYYTYVAYWPWSRMAGMHIVSGSGTWLQCAGAARYLGGNYVNRVYYNMPIVETWRQGSTLSRATPLGTIVVTGWGSDGHYPSALVEAYKDPKSPLYGQTVNHTAVLAYFLKDGSAVLYSQSPKGPIEAAIIPKDQLSQWNEVRVDESNGPYENTPSDRSVTGGNGASSHRGINTRVPSIIGGVFYPYGFGNMSPNMNFAGGRAGTMQGAFTWGQIGDGSTPNFAPSYGGDIVAGGEPDISPGGCFVAGTLILMADRTEKPIESIQVGEEVLAWNEETKTAFPSKVVGALHHDEKMQTLFDIELDDGRRFTANNNHPMYVVEDGDFKFTNDLAARFAKGESITFQDFGNQPVKVASLRMRREICKVYNLHVQGQAMNGHTYYASGILVHNSRAGYKDK